MLIFNKTKLANSKNNKANLKNKNGFTLIELLAIIVILAIIAVITVPIILNIIENSRMGAAKDSAYGYKDSINKWYVSKLSTDPNYNIPDGEYKVGELGEQVEGKVPGNNSWYKVTKNEVTDACLQFDEYKVEIKEGKVNDPEKGQCEELVANTPTIETCPGCVFTYTTDEITIYDEYNDGYLTEYTNDYTSLKDSNENQRTSFLGFVLDDNNKINGYYLCAIKNNDPFCIRFSSYTTLKEKASEYYNAESCQEEHDNYGDGEDNYSCSEEPSVYIEADGPYYFVNYFSLGKCSMTGPSGYDTYLKASCKN